MPNAISSSDHLTRRQFLYLLTTGALGVTAASCFSMPEQVNRVIPSGTREPTQIPPTPMPTSTPPAPTPTFSPDQLSFLVSDDERNFIAAHEVKSGDTSRPVIMMTYDDNAKYAQVRTILDAYNKFGLKATFFFLGEKVRLSAKSVRAIVQEGHLLGCHSYEHIKLLNLNDAQVNRQFSRCFDAVNEIVPGYRMRFVRFPFGEGNGNPRLLRLAAEWGLQHVFWTMGSGGLDRYTYDNVMRNAANGAIVLSHMFRPYDISQAEKIIAGLLDRGFTLETLDTGRDKKDIYQKYPEQAENLTKG